MQNRRLFGLTVLLVALALAGCEPEGGVPEGCKDLAPTHVSPQDGALIGNSGIPLQWLHFTYDDSQCHPSAFLAQHSTTPDFSSDVDQVQLPPDYANYGAAPLEPGTTYYWRVRALWGEDSAAWSPTWMFQTTTACEPSALVEPWPTLPEDGTAISEPSPMFAWEMPGLCTPDGYHLQVASGAEFAAPIADVHHEMPIESSVPEVVLEPCTLYSWRVAAVREGIEGPWSEIHTFWVEAGQACTQACTSGSLSQPDPEAPSLYENVGTAPTEGLVAGLLQWHYPAPCLPEGYAVHLSTEPDFSETSLFGGTGTPETKWSPSVPLKKATQYWWQVAPMIGNQVGPYSYRRSFFTGPACDSAAQLLAPVLASPEDGGVVGTLTPRLRFSIGADGCLPDGYYVDVQTDPGFGGDNVLGLETTQHMRTTYVMAHDLQWCQTYYWRVVSVLNGVWGPFSETWSFTPLSVVACASQAPGILQDVALKDTACHQGPGLDWEILGYFMAGEPAQIQGRDMSGRWLAADNPDNPGQRCWVPREAVELQTDEGALRILNPPAVCRADQQQTECEAMGGRWVAGQSASGAPLPASCQCP